MDGRRHWRSSSKGNLLRASEEATSSGPQRAAGGGNSGCRPSSDAPRDGRDGTAHAQLLAALRARLTSYDDLGAAAAVGTPQLQTLASDVAAQRRQALAHDAAGAWRGEASEPPSPGLAPGAFGRVAWTALPLELLLYKNGLGPKGSPSLALTRPLLLVAPGTRRGSRDDPRAVPVPGACAQFRAKGRSECCGAASSPKAAGAGQPGWRGVTAPWRSGSHPGGWRQRRRRGGRRAPGGV